MSLPVRSMSRKRSSLRPRKQESFDQSNFDAFGISSDIVGFDERGSPSFPVKDRKVVSKKSSSHSFNPFHEVELNDGTSSCVSIESRESLDKSDSREFQITNILQMYEDDRETASHGQGRRNGNHPTIFTERLRRSTKSKSRIRDAEIENVILKQILGSRRYFEEEEEDDDGHISVATGAVSVLSSYTTNDILGDLTDHEDTKSVQMGRRSRSRSRTRIRSSSNKSRRQHTSLSKISPPAAKSVRSRSVVSRRVRLKDADDQGVLGEESTQLYDSFMKNLTAEKISYEAKKRSSSRQHSRSRNSDRSLNTWDPFQDTPQQDDFFASENSFFQTNNTFPSKKKPELKKATLSLLSSAPPDNLFAVTTTKSKSEELSKPPILVSSDRRSSAPNNVDQFTLMLKKKSSSPNMASRQDFPNSFRKSFNESVFLEEKVKPKRMEIETRSFDDIVVHPSQGRRSAVYSFTDTTPITKKSRPKQFMEERSIAELSPVRQRITDGINGPNQSQSKNNWTTFASNRNESKASVANETSLVAVSNFDHTTNKTLNTTWTPFTNKNILPSKNNSVTGSSIQRKTGNTTLEKDFESFPSSSWGYESFKKNNESNDSTTFNFKLSSNIDESTDSSGFRILENSSKSVSKYSCEPSMTHSNQIDPFQSGPTERKSKWDDFVEPQKKKFSRGDWDEEEFQDPFGCDVSKVSASTSSLRSSPTMSSSKSLSRFESNSVGHSSVSGYRSSPTMSVSKFDSSIATHSTVSAYRSSPTYSTESKSSSKFRPSPTKSRSYSGSQNSNWTDVSPSGVAEFNLTAHTSNTGSSRKKLFQPEDRLEAQIIAEEIRN